MSWYILFLAALALVALAYLAYRLVELRANLKFERWKAAHAGAISRDAIRGSQAAVTGRVIERIAPYMPDFGYNPRDVRFIGDPIDFVVFEGLSEGQVRNVVFVEVKSGYSDLNKNERKVRTAIVERRVSWSLFHVPGEQPDTAAGPERRIGHNKR